MSGQRTIPKPIWEFPTYREIRDKSGNLVGEYIRGDDLAEWASQFKSAEEAEPYGNKAARKRRLS